MRRSVLPLIVFIPKLMASPPSVATAQAEGFVLSSDSPSGYDDPVASRITRLLREESHTATTLHSSGSLENLALLAESER